MIRVEGGKGSTEVHQLYNVLYYCIFSTKQNKSDSSQWWPCVGLRPLHFPGKNMRKLSFCLTSIINNTCMDLVINNVL